VFDHACQTAAKVAQVMRQHGMTVQGHSCGPDCEYTHFDLAA
jgi:hypothetical protein